MSIDLMAPNGLPIVGTAEEAIGVARLSHLRRDGEDVDWAYSGQTDGLYDTQMTVTDAEGWTLFEDSDGNWWSRPRLVPHGTAVPDPTPQPDVWCGDQPSIAEGMRLRTENAKLKAVADAAARAWQAKTPGAWHELAMHLREAGLLGTEGGE